MSIIYLGKQINYLTVNETRWQFRVAYFVDLHTSGRGKSGLNKFLKC